MHSGGNFATWFGFLRPSCRRPPLGQGAWKAGTAPPPASSNASGLSAAGGPDSSAAIHIWPERQRQCSHTCKWITGSVMRNEEVSPTWELIPQTPSALSGESKRQTSHWSSTSASVRRLPEEETHVFTTGHNTMRQVNCCWYFTSITDHCCWDYTIEVR